jgi:chemotaxis protein methyltransferase CheR
VARAVLSDHDLAVRAGRGDVPRAGCNVPARARQCGTGSRAELPARLECRGRSGEEPYSLAIAWHLELQSLYPDLRLEVLATDANAIVLERARRARYPAQSLRELPASLRERAFTEEGGEWLLRAALRAGVCFERADLQRQGAPGPFDLIVCRNLAFTYFGDTAQRRVAQHFVEVLRPGGILFVGLGEELPSGVLELAPREPGFYARTPLREASSTGACPRQ